MTKKILFLTQYYPPETGAPQNRLHELAVELVKKGLDIEVLTAMPNYPKMEIFEAYRGKKFTTEYIDEIKIYRSAIYVKKSKSIFYRLLNYFSFVLSSFWYGWIKLPKYAYILVESPPLFLGISGYLLCKIKKAKLIFNVSDLWPESAEKMGLVTNTFFLKSATILEEFLYKKAHLITGQTQGIVHDIQTRFPQKAVYWLPNGVNLTLYDNQKITSDWRAKNGFNATDLLFLYAGIIGHAQGLEVILYAAEKLKQHTDIKFLIIGDGPVKNDLIQLNTQLQLTNVHFFSSVSKLAIPAIIKASTATIIPLKKIPLFEGAIPSKIFENLALEKPLLLGVNGEAKTLFIDEANAGLHFDPENSDALAEKILIFKQQPQLINELGKNGREYVTEKFNRTQIAADFHTHLYRLTE